MTSRAVPAVHCGPAKMAALSAGRTAAAVREGETEGGEGRRGSVMAAEEME